jgi:hypothetical protein
MTTNGNGHNGHNGHGCAYLVEEPDGRRVCGSPRKPGSSYCANHHAMCHLAPGSRGEAKSLKNYEEIAGAGARWVTQVPAAVRR